MKIKVYTIVSGIPVKSYILTYSGNDVTINEVEDILKQAKKNFKIMGRMFILVANEKVFLISKQPKKWNIYQMSGVDDELD